MYKHEGTNGLTNAKHHREKLEILKTIFDQNQLFFLVKK